ncbi:MAG: glycosyltransferase [Spirochaetes bacterium]|nr:glycosyltransferase [Spirochaetota bacterium]
MADRLIIIPAYNEEETIREVVTRALKYADVSVTDDGSRDLTPEILKEIQNECRTGRHPHILNIITHQQTTHIPRSVQDGLRFGIQKGYRTFVTMDAGLSHDPEALPDFFNYSPGTDVVIGSRKFTANVPLYRKAITWMGARVINYTLSDSYFNFFGPGIKDCTSGFRKYSLRAAKKIAESELKSVSFDFHTEALALCVREGMSVAEIPIVYVFSNSSFNKQVLIQAMKFLAHLLRTKKG